MNIACPFVVPAPQYAYGMSEENRVGNISASSTTFTITSAPYVNGMTSRFSVGNYVIVEVGGEAGAGAYGTTGVGGEGSDADYGDYQYYTNNGWPKALLARITAVSSGGGTLTLDTAATVTATGARIYFDNRRILQNLLPPTGTATTINLPRGRFAMSGGIENAGGGLEVDGWTIAGQGKTVTTLFAPKGSPGCGMLLFANNTTIRDLRIVGNARQEGYGIENTGTFPLAPGINLIGVSNTVTNVTVQDVFLKAVWFTGGIDCVCTDCEFIQTDAIRNYFANWFFGVSDGDTCTFTRCRVVSTWATWGFETFRSSGVTFTDCYSQNAMFSSNSSGLWALTNHTVLYTAGCNYLAGSGGVTLSGNPICQANSNISPPDATMILGGTITNMNAYIAGEWASGSQPACININSDNPNISIDGTLITYVDAGWACGVNSTGDNTDVSNLTVVGTITLAQTPFANIAVSATGSITGCTANRKTVGGVDV